MRIPNAVQPIVRNVASAYSLPLEFWRSNNGNKILDCFFELATGLSVSGLDLANFPQGYRMVATLFQWENECQAEGWNAFEWHPNVFEVVRDYSDVGLIEEGEAISRAAIAWKESLGNVDATAAAYRSQKHQYNIDLDRLEYLVDYFCEHAEKMFYDDEVLT